MKIEKQNPGFAKRVKSWLTGKYVENGSTASQNIPAGKWVTWKGQVCKAKTAITTGDTLSATNLDTDEEGALNSKIFFEEYSQNPNSMGMYDVPFKSGYILLGAVFTDESSYFGGAGIEGSVYYLRMTNYAGDNKTHSPCHAILIWLKT